MDVQTPTLAGLLDSNAAHVDRAYDLIARDGRRKVALFGLAIQARHRRPARLSAGDAGRAPHRTRL
jgi:hypothetical protein